MAIFIRRTQTRGTADGQAYTKDLLVRWQRIEGKVRQVTLLNLDSNLAIERALWPLCAAVCTNSLGASKGRLWSRYRRRSRSRPSTWRRSCLPSSRPNPSRRRRRAMGSRSMSSQWR